MADQNFTVNCGFFNSVNRDRLYNANHMNKPYRRLVSNGVFATPQGQPSTDLQVLSESDGMKIGVSIGEAIFADKWFENTSKIVITVPNNASLLPRRDSVIAQVDNRENGRVGRIVYRTGTPANNPLPPDIGTVTDVVEYRLANIYVASGATAINQDAIVDLRGSEECPWVTHLLYQVDTSELFRQWQSAYENYYHESAEEFEEWSQDQKETFETWLAQLTEELTVGTTIITYESHYTTPSDGTTVIPINIASFDKSKDVLMVRINHLFASETTDYTISSNSSQITLTKDLDANQSVDFIVLQSVIVGDTTTVLTEIRALNTVLSNAIADTGWVNLSLQNGAQAYSASLTPSYRRYGKEVYLRGCLKGVTLNTIFATLPEGFRPAMVRYFTVATSNITVTIEMGVNGQLKIANVIGTLTTGGLVPIDTQFITG